MSFSSETKRFLMNAARAVYALSTVAIVLMALAMLNIGGH
jgi:hypothetical protein